MEGISGLAQELLDGAQERFGGFGNYWMENRASVVIQVVCGLYLIVRYFHVFPKSFPFGPKHILGKKKKLPAIWKTLEDGNLELVADGGAHKCRVIGHRGSSSEGLPENTIAAFEYAVKAGVDSLELDVRYSKDGKLVVFHDPLFTRMTCATNNDVVSETKYEDFPKLVPTALQRSNLKSVKDRKHWENIPLLTEVLDMLPADIGVIIELKGPLTVDYHEETSIDTETEKEKEAEKGKEKPDLAEDVLKVIRSLSKIRQRKIIWAALDSSTNLRLGKVDDSIPCLSSIANQLRLVAYYYLGVLPFVSLRCDVYLADLKAITRDMVFSEPSISNWPNWSKELLTHFIKGKEGQGSPWFIVPKMFALLRKMGVQVLVLGVDTIDAAAVASRVGASGIFTDKPQFMSAYVKKNKLRLSQVHD